MKSLSLSQPHLLIVTGVPGSGKTFFAEKFASTFRAPFVNYEKIALLCNGSDEQVVDELFGYQLNELLKTGQTILVEGAGETRTGRAELTRRAKEAGYAPLIVWVQTDPSTAKDRLTRPSKNNTEHLLTPEEYDRSFKRFTPPSAVEKTVVVSGKHTYATQAKVVLKKLTAPRAEISAHSTPIATREPGRRNITVR
jgi:predicted kinase